MMKMQNKWNVKMKEHRRKCFPITCHYKITLSINVKILMSDTNHGNAKNNHYVWQFVTKSWQSMRRVLLVIYKVVIEFKWKFSFKMCDFKMEKI